MRFFAEPVTVMTSLRPRSRIPCPMKIDPRKTASASSTSPTSSASGRPLIARDDTAADTAAQAAAVPRTGSRRPDDLVDVGGRRLERIGDLLALGVRVEQRLHPPVCDLEVTRDRRDEYERVALDQRPRNVVEGAPRGGVLTEALVVPDA